MLWPITVSFPDGLPAPGPGKWGHGPYYCVFLGSMSQPQKAKAKSIFLSLEHFFGGGIKEGLTWGRSQLSRGYD